MASNIVNAATCFAYHRFAPRKRGIADYVRFAAMWLLAAVTVVMVSAAIAAIPNARPVDADDNTVYTIKRGDTLIGIGERYFIRASDYTQVQRLNGIANPYRIKVGRSIIIPRTILKFRPIAVNLANFRGPVTVNGGAAQAGAALNEGAILRTGAKGFASLAFDNGTRMAMPSNSQLSIRRARIFIIDNSRDVEIDLTSGGVRSKIQPQTNPADRTRIRTRHSVTAVRGTEFGTSVTVDDKGVLSEVYEGSVALDSATDAATAAGTNRVTAANVLKTGEGARLSADGGRLVVRLLPAPELADPGKIQSGEILTFNIANSAPGSVAHRIEIAADASFIDQILDERVTVREITLPSLADGRYFVRLSSIDANELVGLPVSYTFRRVQSGASASAGATDDGFLFRWQTFGEKRPDVRLRIYSGSVDTTPWVDETALPGDGFKLSQLPPGTYFWQIGTRVIDAGDIVENWTEPEKLIVAP